MRDQIELIGEYVARPIAPDEFGVLFQEHRPTVFANSFAFNAYGALTKHELDAQVRLRERLADRYRLYLGLYRGDEFVGWSWGMQEGVEKYNMVNTGILPAHQGKGIYKALLPHILELVRNEGFQVVYSRHSATNNQVIIPKLRAGFIITALEVTDTFGTLVHLSYFFNDMRRRVMQVRTGEAAPDAEVRIALGL